MRRDQLLTMLTRRLADVALGNRTITEERREVYAQSPTIAELLEAQSYSTVLESQTRNESFK